jgi:hypothetical protein
MTRPTTLTVTTEISLTRVADLLCCAFEGGVGYWCEIERYRKPRKPVAHVSREGHVFPHIDFPLCAGGAVVCRDTEDEDRPLMVLDLHAVKRGLALMPKVAPRHWADFIAENDDATTGDVFIQICLLGEIVYG